MVRQKASRVDYLMRNPIPLDGGRVNVLLRGTRFYARIWSAKLKKYHWRSLRTSDLSEAKRRARKLLYEAESKEARGLPLTSKPMSEVIDAYVAMRTREVERGETQRDNLRQIKRNAAFWKEFIGKRSVDEVNDKELREFVEWRRDYYTTRPKPPNAKTYPTDKEVQYNLTIGKAILKWAAEKSWRSSEGLPRFSFTASKLRVRPAFNLSDFKKLVQTLEDRAKRSKGSKFRKSRELLFYYVTVLANSGIRTGEANSLRMRHVETIEDKSGNQNFILHVKGKVGYRPAVFVKEAAPTLERWLSMREGARPDDRLFVMPDGSPIKNLGDQFKAALKEAGIERDRYGQPYVLYSLRHFYATQAVKHGIDVYAISKNMGTSIKMIETYYTKSTNSRDFDEKLGGIIFRSQVDPTIEKDQVWAKTQEEWWKKFSSRVKETKKKSLPK